MRSVAFVLLFGVVLLAPGALALGTMSLAAEPTVDPAPEETEVGGPRATSVSVEGQQAQVDTASTGADAPVDVMGEVETRRVDVSADGPRCKLNFDTTDEVAERCSAGSVTTNAGTDLLRASVAVRLPEGESPDEAPEDGAAVQTTRLDAGPAASAVVAAAAAGASAAALYGLWRLLKWTGLAAFLPLYSHISDDEMLDDPNRGAIYRLIQREPGVSTKDIADRLGLAWGTVTHHLAKLEKRRFVVSKKYGKYRRFFANGAGHGDVKDAVAVLRLDRTGDVAELIRERPGVTQKEVSDLLGVSSSTILWHVKRLEEVALVTKVREGKQVRYYPGAGLDSVRLVAPPATPTAA